MTTPILDLDANDSSGATGNSYVTTFTENGPAVAVADVDVLITNSIGTIYDAVISGGRGQFDSLAVSGTLPDEITAFDNAGALILSKPAGARVGDDQRQRYLQLHAECRLQRPGQFQVQGQRRHARQ